MDYVRDGIGGIEGILHNENGAGYDTTDNTPTPLVDDTCGQKEIPPKALGMVEEWDEIDEVSFPIDMMMR